MNASTDLPPANPAAAGLHLTSDEWAAVQDFISSERAFQRVWIFGSRFHGRRSAPPKVTPPDIDLAVELDAPNYHRRIRLGAEIRRRRGAFLTGHKIDLQWYQATNEIAEARRSGRLLLDKT
jgi:hypothetical protein